MQACKSSVPNSRARDFNSDMTEGRIAERIRPRVVPSLTKELNMGHLAMHSELKSRIHSLNSTVRPPRGQQWLRSLNYEFSELKPGLNTLIFISEQSLTVFLLSGLEIDASREYFLMRIHTPFVKLALLGV